MAKKLSTLFFSTLKKVARQQRKAMKLARPVARSTTSRGSPSKPRKAAATVATRGLAPAITPLTKEGLPPPGKGSWQTFVHKPQTGVLWGGLTFYLYRPAGLSLAGRPLVIMLHGCRQTSHEFALGSRMNRLADSKGFVVAYPQQSKRIQSMQCWRWFQPQRAQGLAEADAIADLARMLVSKYRLDASRVYVAGLSAGAGMAALTVLRHPEQFAAAALHSGVVVGAAHSATAGLRIMRKGADGDLRALVHPLVGGSAVAGLSSFAKTNSADAGQLPGMPVMILHGQRDHIVSARNALKLAEQFSYLNDTSAIKDSVLARGTHREYVRQDFLKGGRIMVRLGLIKEVGHAWSGGDARLKFHSAKGPSASVLMWAFFAMHSRE